MRGGLESYDACRKESRRLRDCGARELKAPSAALVPGGAGGWQVNGGLQSAPDRDGFVIALFGRRPELVGWIAAMAGRPPGDLLQRVRLLGVE